MDGVRCFPSVRVSAEKTLELMSLRSHKRGNYWQRKILGTEHAFPCRMDARRHIYIAAPRAPLRPLAKLAVRVLGPGPLRLRMVRYVHELDREPSVERARAA
jgi:hypothetical protein